MCISQALQKNPHMHASVAHIGHRTLQAPEYASHYNDLAAYLHLAHIARQLDRDIRLTQHEAQPFNLDIRNYRRSGFPRIRQQTPDLRLPPQLTETGLLAPYKNNRGDYQSLHLLHTVTPTMNFLLNRYIALKGKLLKPVCDTPFAVSMNHDGHPCPVYGFAVVCPIDRRYDTGLN